VSDLRAQLKLIPNQLTALRLLLTPALWLLALLDQPRLVGGGLLLALLTDVLDGWLARRLRQTSAFGAAFDSLADKVITCSVVGWLALLRPELFREHPGWITVAAVIFAISLLIGWIKWGRPAPLHLYSARLGGFFQALFVLHALLADAYSPQLLALALSLGVLAALEECAVQLTHSEIDPQIRSILPLPGRRDARA
jgi:CDP-diacylglycerol--glycerol-3-phosphate 3-phosphatidyltransferase